MGNSNYKVYLIKNEKTQEVLKPVVFSNNEEIILFTMLSKLSPHHLSLPNAKDNYITKNWKDLSLYLSSSKDGNVVSLHNEFIIKLKDLGKGAKNEKK